jgi:hypothetical protein
MVEHMLLQVRPARTRDGKNRYRMSDGRMCPVGALLGPGSRDVENLSAVDPFIHELLMRKGHNAGLCWSVQAIHDHVPPEDWPVYRRRIADWYRLSARVVDELASAFVAQLKLAA